MDKIFKVTTLKDSRDINKIGAWLQTQDFFKDKLAVRITWWILALWSIFMQLMLSFLVFTELT